MRKSFFSSLAFAAIACGANAVSFSYTSANGTSNYNYSNNTTAAFSNMYLIPDFNTTTGVSASVVVSGTGLVISGNLSIRFENLAHTYIGDTTAWLSNGTQNVILWDRPGADDAGDFGSGFNFDPNRSYTIGEAGTLSWTSTDGLGTLAQSSLISGVRAPLSSAFSEIEPTLSNVVTLSGLNGLALDGTWTVKIVDRTEEDLGAFKNFTISGDAVPEPASMTALGLGIAAMLRRRRAEKK